MTGRSPAGNARARRDEDPVLARLREWDEASLALSTKQAEVRSRLRRLPSRVREWKGVFLGHGIGFEGRPVALRTREAALIEEAFDRRLVEAEDEDERQSIAAERAEALEELGTMQRADRSAREAAGLPFDCDDEAAFWEPYLSRVEAAAEAVAETPAASLDGMFAKLDLAARLTREALEEDPDGEPAGFDIARRLVLSAATDAERLKGR